MANKQGFQSMASLFDNDKKISPKKPPAHEWQELALAIIEKLNIPNFKRSSVFKICKNHPKTFVERCLSDTMELCEEGEKWKYFFKVVASGKK
jgi:hypothetical protein